MTTETTPFDPAKCRYPVALGALLLGLALTGCGHNSEPVDDATAMHRAVQAAPDWINQCWHGGEKIPRLEAGADSGPIVAAAAKASRVCNQAVPTLLLARMKDCVDFAQTSRMLADGSVDYFRRRDPAVADHLVLLGKQRIEQYARCQQSAAGAG